MKSLARWRRRRLYDGCDGAPQAPLRQHANRLLLCPLPLLLGPLPLLLGTLPLLLGTLLAEEVASNQLLRQAGSFCSRLACSSSQLLQQL